MLWQKVGIIDVSKLLPSENFPRVDLQTYSHEDVGFQIKIYFIVPEEIEQRVGGKTITVTVWAKSAADNPSPSFAVAYSTAAVGNSGWQTFEPGTAVSAHRFDYEVPEPKGAPGRDFIGIWADTDGKGRAIDVEGVEVVLKDGS